MLEGNMDDYELVAGAPSDSEMEGDDKTSAQASHNSLGRDLRQFARSWHRQDERSGDRLLFKVGASRARGAAA